MSPKNIKKASRTNWEKLKNMKDKEIDYSDIPTLDSKFFQSAILKMPEPKSLITIRIDSDVITWLKKQGKGYQTRINSILRLYMEAHP